MGTKLHMLQFTVSVWGLLSVAILVFFAMLSNGPGEIVLCTNCIGGSAEYWLDVILIANGIVWGAAYWGGQVYLAVRPKKLVEEDGEWE